MSSVHEPKAKVSYWKEWKDTVFFIINNESSFSYRIVNQA